MHVIACVLPGTLDRDNTLARLPVCTQQLFFPPQKHIYIYRNTHTHIQYLFNFIYAYRYYMCLQSLTSLFGVFGGRSACQQVKTDLANLMGEAHPWESRHPAAKQRMIAVPSGNLLHGYWWGIYNLVICNSYWKLSFIDDLPLKHSDFPIRTQ